MEDQRNYDITSDKSESCAAEKGKGFLVRLSRTCTCVRAYVRVRTRVKNYLIQTPRQKHFGEKLSLYRFKIRSEKTLNAIL